ncbi:MAG: PAS domain-containing protein [Marinibacterium sp.]|nr:PAS domain-containing protein [Marinibacterium sp.]
MKFGSNAERQKGKVIEMDRFRSGASLSPLRQIEAYWTALRDEGDIPKRSQIDPRGLEQMLKYAFILERIAPGIARFRIAGHHLSDVMGMEVRGMPFTALFGSRCRGQICDIVEHVFDRPAIQELQLSSTDGRIEARAILLPLRGEGGEVSRIIGALVCDGASAGDAGCGQLVLDDCRERAINGDPAPIRAPQPAQALNAGFAEDQDGYAAPRAPHLRLIKTDG